MGGLVSRGAAEAAIRWYSRSGKTPIVQRQRPSMARRPETEGNARRNASQAARLYSGMGQRPPTHRRAGDVSAMQRELMAHGPFEVAFYVYSDFYKYDGGVSSRASGARARWPCSEAHRLGR